MRSTVTLFAVMAFALLIVGVCFTLPSFAEDTTPAPAISTAPTNETPSGLESAAPAPGDEPSPTKREKGRLVLVPAFSMYYPTDAKTQSRFGDAWPSLGLSFAWRDKRTEARKIELRLDGIGTISDDYTAYIFPLGIGISQRLSTSKNLTTYAGVSGNLYFGKVISVPDHVRTGWHMVAGPGVYLGANIGSRFNIQASYYGVPDLGGFGLSGFNLSAHVQLF